MSKGMFIAFEGPDGVGKTSTIQGVANALQKRGYKPDEIVVIQDPGTSQFGQVMRPILKGSKVPMTSMTQLMTFLACRIQMAQEVILPSLRAGKAVLCDRYTMSTIVYQVLASRQKWEPFMEIFKRTEVVIPSVYVVLNAEYSVLRSRRLAARWCEFFMPAEMANDIVSATLTLKRPAMKVALEKAREYYLNTDDAEDLKTSVEELILWAEANDSESLRQFAKSPRDVSSEELKALLTSDSRCARLFGQWKAHLAGCPASAVALVCDDRFETDRFQRRVAGCYDAAICLVQGDAPIIEEDTTHSTIDQVVENVVDTIMNLRNA